MSKLVNFSTVEDLVSYLKKKKNSTDSITKALTLYREFHSTLPSSILDIADGRDKSLPKLTLAIGILDSVVYQPFGNTKKSTAKYIHKFGDGGAKGYSKEKPILVAGGDGSLYIVRNKSKYTVEKAGIVF